MQSAAKSRERNLKYDAEMAIDADTSQIDESSSDDELDAQIESMQEELDHYKAIIQRLSIAQEELDHYKATIQRVQPELALLLQQEFQRRQQQLGLVASRPLPHFSSHDQILPQHQQQIQTNQLGHQQPQHHLQQRAGAGTDESSS